MKKYAFILALAFITASLAFSLPVFARADSMGLDSGLPLYAQNQPHSSEDVSVFQGQDEQDSMEMQEPQGGARSILPLFFLVVIYFIIRRMYKNMGSGDDNPFGSGRFFDDSSGPRRPEDEPEQMKDAYDNARKMWDTFNARPGHDVPAGRPRPAPEDGEDAVPQQEPEATSGKIIEIKTQSARPVPPNHGQDNAGQDAGDDEFLMGARLVFERIVEALDGLDLDTAAHFAGLGVLNEIKHRMNEGHPPAKSEVVRVDAKVMSRSVENGTASITVYYDGVKKVSGIGPIGPVPVREIWTFTKDDNDPAAMWMLQSMEPVEA